MKRSQRQSQHCPGTRLSLPSRPRNRHHGQLPAPLIETLSDDELLTLIAFFDAGRRVSLEWAARIRGRVGERKASLRYRIEQAKGLRDEGKELLKAIKSDIKNLVSMVIVNGGSRWEQHEGGHWVEVSEDDTT